MKQVIYLFIYCLSVQSDFNHKSLRLPVVHWLPLPFQVKFVFELLKKNYKMIFHPYLE